MGDGASSNRGERRRGRVAVLLLVLLGATVALLGPGLAGAQGQGSSGGDPAEVGEFEAPFEEPGPGEPPFGSDSSKCVVVPPDEQTEEQKMADPDEDGFFDCKVAAASTNLAPNGDFIYWNALEATENVRGTIVSEFGITSIDDQSRALENPGDPGKRRYSKPTPVDGGANPDGNFDSDPLIPGAESGETQNDGAMFCADLNFLPDGRILTVGGTDYSSDPGAPPDAGETDLSDLSTDQILDLLEALPGGTSLEDVADAVPGGFTSVDDLVNGVSGLPDLGSGGDGGSPGGGSSDSQGDTSLGDLSSGQLEELAEELDNDQLEDLVKKLSDAELRDLFPGLALPGSSDGQTPDSSVGATELEGIKNSRIYDPKTKRWTQTGSMSEGRWYPTLVTLAGGDTFVVSGLRKLIRPIFFPGDEEAPGLDPKDPETVNPGENSANNEETETFDSSTGDWDLNGPKDDAMDPSDRQLPLFARIHLLPNGHVFYNAAGQAFNPFGQDPQEAMWNLLSSYDPESKSWTTLGTPGLDDSEDPRTPEAKAASATTPSTPGFRGSTFSVELPLRPNADGEYEQAEFLTAGGLPAAGAPSPGTYFPTKASRITKVDTSDDTPTTKTRNTGPLNQGGEKGFGRWYSAGTLLPTGEVLASSGGDVDEVAFPGSEAAIKTMELFDPSTETWRNVATQEKPRTYHNTATLMPDGRVLIAGHATISTGYGRNAGVPAPNASAEAAQVTPPQDDGQVTGAQGHDPTMEIWSPPSLFRGARPTITEDVECRQDYGADMEISTDTDVSEVESVVLMRNASTTHIVDGDQKSVLLDIDEQKSQGTSLVVKNPPSGEVAPPGPYMLFVNKKTAEGPTPSVSKQVSFGGSGTCGAGGGDGDDDGQGNGGGDGGNGNDDGSGAEGGLGGVLGIDAIGSKCLPSGMRASSRGIGTLRLGATRARIALSAGPPANIARRAFRYCVLGGGRTYVSFSGRGLAQMVVSVQAQRGPRGLTRGNSTSDVRRAYEDARPLGKKQLVASLPGGGAVVFGIKEGRVRYVAVIDSRLAGDLNRVRYYLRGVRLQ